MSPPQGTSADMTGTDNTASRTAGRAVPLTAPTLPMHPAPLKSATWMVGAIFCFLSMAASGRELSGNISVFETLAIRSFIGVFIILAIALHLGILPWRTKRLGLHFTRNVFHFGGQFAWFFAIGLIPLAEVFAIEFTSPIWLLILAPFFLGERMTRPRLIAVAFGFAGILLILRPGFAEIGLGSYVMALGAFGFGITNLVTKKLTSSEHALTILFYMTLLQFPMGLVPAIFVSGWVWPEPSSYIWLLIIAFGGLGAHFSITQAYRHADATLAAPVDYLRLPLASLMGWILYSEGVDLWLVAGATLIIGGNAINLFGSRRKAQAIRRTT